MEKIDLRKQSNETLYELRKQIVRQKERGISNIEVAANTGLSKDYVSKVWCRYKKGTINALKPKKRGRVAEKSCKLNKEQQKEICQIIIDKTPDQLKLAFALWTRQAICDLIKRKYNITLTLRSISNYLEAWGLTCQRPTKRAFSQDDVRVRKFMEEEYPAIAKKAKAEKAIIYWGDEVGLSNQENYQRGFAPKGHPPVLEVAAKRERINMLSAITNQGKVRFMIFHDSMNQQKLIEFMRRMIKDIPQKIFLLLDNLKVHHGRIVREWLEKHKNRIEVFYLPPYSPELNPDEYLNCALKHDVHGGIKPHTAREMESKTQSFMRRLQHNPDKVKAFFKHKKLAYLKSYISLPG
jgi:transposase